jgi:hypothetical protein
MKKATTLVSLVLLGAIVAGCTGSRAGDGAVVGGLTGAAIGGIAGGSVGAAVIGAGAGAVAGAIIADATGRCYWVDRNNKRHYTSCR